LRKVGLPLFPRGYMMVLLIEDKHGVESVVR
jgi:hypothetical protein